MFGKLAGGKGYSGEHDKQLLVILKEIISVITIKFQRWRQLSQKAGIWIRRVGAGEACWSFGNGMRRRDAQLQRDAQRWQERSPPSTSLSGRREASS